MVVVVAVVVVAVVPVAVVPVAVVPVVVVAVVPVVWETAAPPGRATTTASRTPASAHTSITMPRPARLTPRAYRPKPWDRCQ